MKRRKNQNEAVAYDAIEIIPVLQGGDREKLWYLQYRVGTERSSKIFTNSRSPIIFQRNITISENPTISKIKGGKWSPRPPYLCCKDH